MTKETEQQAQTTETLPVLFVYGTLQGKGDVPGRKYLGKASTVGRFVMYASPTGGYPCVRPTHPEIPSVFYGHVSGELYEISEPGIWDHYDAYEGHPDFFTRKVIGIQKEDGDLIEAWMYFGPESVSKRGPEGLRLPEDHVLTWSYP